MVLQATRAGLQAIIQGYLDSVPCRLILLDGSDDLTETATVADFVVLEPSRAEGYARQLITPTGWGWDEVEDAIKCLPISAPYTAGVAGTIQFDAVALLADGRAIANTEVTSIALNVFTAVAHGLANGSKVFFTDAAETPTGITLGTTYYVTDANTNNFKVSDTSAGAPITVGTDFVGPLIVRSIDGTIICWEQRPDDGSGDRTYTINAGQTHSVSFQIGQKLG